MESKTFKVVNGIAALMFLISATLQYNDPDPIRWAALYGSATLACLVAGRFPLSWLPAAAVGLVSLVWIGTLSWVLPDLKLTELARSMKAETPSIELGREFMGLLIVFGWMIGLVVLSRRGR